MKRLALLGVLAFVAVGFVACGDDGNSTSFVLPDSSSSSEKGDSALEQVRGDNEAGMTFSNSADSSSSAATSSAFESSSSVAESSAAEISSSSSVDTLRITYSLKPFDGPLPNPHKGFTVPTEGTWVFVPEFEYGPYGSLNNKAWDLVTYGSGYQKWNTFG